MTYSAEEKGMWLEDWKQSGQNAWAYAEANGLIPQTFARWVRKETELKPDFVEIHPNERSYPQASEILIKKGNLEIHIPLGIGIKELRTVLDALGVKL